MSPQPEHRFAFDYFNADGAPLGTLACDLYAGIDLEPANEWLRHLALQRDLPQRDSALAPLVASPVWSDRGAPFCSAVRVAITSGGEEVACELEPDYFRPAAERSASQLVAQGKLGANDHFLFHVCAYPQARPASVPGMQPAPNGAGDNDFSVELAPEPLAIGTAAVAPLLEAATWHGEPDFADIAVFLPAKVLAEVTEIARAAGELESGGVLAGKLQRCPERGELFVEVTAAIPARHGEAGTGSFTFTPETWTAVDSALRLRGGREILVGWFHSHPRFCARCPLERQRNCVFANPFFSGDDKHLQRTVFPLGHQVGLLISDLPERGHVPALYGWRRGVIAERGYHELP